MTSDFKPYIDLLKSSGLRPTEQRLTICKILFNRYETFHFTIENLKEMIKKEVKNKISLATLYNTVNAFKKNGFLKEISLGGNKIFFDTNISNHHHFYDEDLGKLFDIKNEKILVSKVPSAPIGKKIKKIEIIVRVACDNHNQKKIN